MSRRSRHVTVAVVTAAVALGGVGLAMASAGSSGGDALAASPTPEGFVGVSPVRVLDTREGDGPIGVANAVPLGAGEQLDLALTTPAPNRPVTPVPANAASVLLNITIDRNASAPSFVTVWPTGQPRPNTSANNANPGLVMPNPILVPLGAGGQVSFYNFAGNVNLAVDLAGYTVPLTQGGTGPSGPSGPSGPPGFGGWRQVAGTVVVPIGGADPPEATIVETTGMPDDSYLITASFSLLIEDAGAEVACEIRNADNDPITTANWSGPVDTVRSTLTAVAATTTGASLFCLIGGGGSALISQAHLIAVQVGNPIP
jgi:hypothetical protein